MLFGAERYIIETLDDRTADLKTVQYQSFAWVCRRATAVASQPPPKFQATVGNQNATCFDAGAKISKTAPKLNFSINMSFFYMKAYFLFFLPDDWLALSWTSLFHSRTSSRRCSASLACSCCLIML